MKKIKGVIKKIIATIIVFFTTIYTKVLAYYYGSADPSVPVYGIPEPEPLLVRTWNVLKWALIPIAFIIGSIIYFKKSKLEKEQKMIRVLIVALILVIILIYYIMLQ